jgi:hypothetical protein
MPQPPPPPAGSILEAPCRAIAAAAGDLLAWGFDPRFRAANAAFPTSAQAPVRAALERGFDGCWSAADIAHAPARVGELAARTGGMRGGQLLFGANVAADPILFGLWWPWGDGATISIRILFSARTLDAAAKSDLLEEFQGWFGLRG